MSERTFFLFWLGFIYSTCKTSRVGIWYNTPFLFCSWITFTLALGSFTKQLRYTFFTRKSLVKLFLFNFNKDFPINWSGTFNRSLYKRIPCNLDLGSFYKGFPLKTKFTGKSFVKFFPTFKLKIEFHSHKKVVSPKLENSAHLFKMNFKRAKFQKN